MGKAHDFSIIGLDVFFVDFLSRSKPNFNELTSAKVAIFNITAKTSITILTSTITSPCSIFQ